MVVGDRAILGRLRIHRRAFPHHRSWRVASYGNLRGGLSTMKYDPLKNFWEHNTPAYRLMFLRDWGIYKKPLHPMISTLSWEQLIEEPDEVVQIIRKAHRKAVNSSN